MDTSLPGGHAHRPVYQETVGRRTMRLTSCDRVPRPRRKDYLVRRGGLRPLAPLHSLAALARKDNSLAAAEQYGRSRTARDPPDRAQWIAHCELSTAHVDRGH